MYNVHTDLLIMAAFGLLLILTGLVMTRREREIPPRWVEDANGPLKPRHAKRARGYDPVIRVAVRYDVKTVDLGRLK